MTRRVGMVCALVAVATTLYADASSRVRRELRSVRRARRGDMSREERVSERAMREVEAEHRRLRRREVEIKPQYRTEAALIYLDRERGAGRDPFELERERDRQLAAERFQIDGLRYGSAADRRLGSETQRLRRARGMADRAGSGPYGQQLQRAEQWAIDGATAAVIREQMRRQEIIRRVLEVADELEREAQAKEQEAERDRR